MIRVGCICRDCLANRVNGNNLQKKRKGILKFSFDKVDIKISFLALIISNSCQEGDYLSIFLRGKGSHQ